MTDSKTITVDARRAAIAAIGETQDDFSREAGVSKPTLNSWLQGKDVTVVKEVAILDAIARSGWRFYGGGVIPRRHN